MASVEYNVLLQTYQGGFEEQYERIYYWFQRRREAEILIFDKIPSQCLIINKIKGDAKTHPGLILFDMLCSLEENYNDIITEHDFISQNPETLKIREAMTNALITLKSSGIPLTFTM